MSRIQWARVGADYVPYGGSSQTFAKSAEAFTAGSIAKNTGPISARQQHFEQQLRQLSELIGSPRLPVFIQFADGRRRMDKGCIGHAIASGFLRPATDTSRGFVEWVELAH